MRALWARVLVMACLIGIAEEGAVVELEPRRGEIDIDSQREACAKRIVLVDFVNIDQASVLGKPHIEKRFSGAPLAAGWFLSFMALGIWVAWHAHERESVGLGILAFLAFSAAIPGSFMLLLRLNGLL